MNKLIQSNILRFILILLFQVLVCKGINLNQGSFQYFHVLFYPIAILLLPVNMPKPYVLLSAFALGIMVDVFYDSLGIHASASVFLAYARSYILKILEPRGGYSVKNSGLENMEFSWFISYLSISMVIFLVVYFSMDAFSFVYFGRIVLNTLFSFILSVSLILIYQVIFRSRT
jgi:hypothetical protein